MPDGTLSGNGTAPRLDGRTTFPPRGWFGLGLALVCWGINWRWPGLRTHWAFFPMWVGYCLTVDALVFRRTGTSLVARGLPRYLGLFLASAPSWWLFEIINLRTQNWIYLGVDEFPPLAYAFWTTLSFSTVLPAVLASAELAASFGFVRRLPRGPRLVPTRTITLAFFAAGWAMLALLLAWPKLFFPLVWLSVYFILEPINIWRGNHNLAEYTRRADWRPVYALWLGVLLTAFFWEMWNFLSMPKWIYSIPWNAGPHVFEMPILGYGGYLPFALELLALYHLITGFLHTHQSDYVRLEPR